MDYFHIRAKPRPITLLALPIELQTKIYCFAVAHHANIRPLQWETKSAKFGQDAYKELTIIDYMGYHWTYRRDYENKCLPDALTVVNLTAVCKAIHQILDQGNWFYALNTFQFPSPYEMLAYLAVLTPPERAAIRSIDFAYSAYMAYIPAFTVLSACDKLESLRIDISRIGSYFDTGALSFNSDASGFEILKSLRGLKKVELYWDTFPLDSIDEVIEIVRALDATEETRGDLIKEIKELKEGILHVVKQPRSSNSMPLVVQQDINAAIEKAPVDWRTADPNFDPYFERRLIWENEDLALLTAYQEYEEYWNTPEAWGNYPW